MSNFYLFVLILVSIFYRKTSARYVYIYQPESPIIQDYPCPVEDIEGGCRGPKDCLYSDPRTCDYFIQCSAGGIAYQMPCAAGTQWNDDKKLCDWPYRSTCARSKLNTTPKPITTLKPTTTLKPSTEPYTVKTTSESDPFILQDA